MNITVLSLGKLKEQFFIEAEKEYSKRLTSYCKLNIVEIEAEKLPSEPKASQIEKALETEAERIFKAIPKNSTVIAMCVEGKQVSSEELADLVKNSALFGESHLVFIIGSSYGLSSAVKAASKYRLSVSKMTFPHRLFRIMLLEQIYRAFKINEGSNYHK